MTGFAKEPDTVAEATWRSGASVIIPVCNGAQWIGDQLEGLRKQECPCPWEVIVVDNGSTDQTAQVVRDFQRRFPHLRYRFADETAGPAYARNIGVSIARYDRLLFVDCDDIVGDGWLSALSGALAENDFVMGLMELQLLNQGIGTGTDKYSKVSWDSKAHGFMRYAMGCNMGVSRRAFEAIGGFSTHFRLQQDVDFSWRLQEAGYPLVLEKKAVLHYRYRPELGGIWKQRFKHGKFHPYLYKMWEPKGMPGVPIKEALRRYRWILRNFPPPSGYVRLRWVRQVALSTGRLVGSVLHRRLYL